MILELSKGKRGGWDLPLWLIWSLVAIVIGLGIFALSSGKMSDFLLTIGTLIKPG
jgi:hypothetical protein